MLSSYESRVLKFLRRENRNQNRNPRRKSNLTSRSACLIGGDPLHRLLLLEIKMKIATEEFEELFKDYPLYSPEEESDPLVVAKLFDPCGSATWYLTEYDPVEKIAFGYVKGMMADEFGYVSLTELESIQRPFGLTIERDLYFVQKRLSEVK